MQLLPLRHKEDLNLLPDHMRKNAIRVMAELKTNPWLGVELKPLKEHQVHTRSLDDCRAVKIHDEYESEMRVVYRILKDKDAIEIIAIGPRMGSEVYRTAMERLSPVKRRRVRPWRKT